MVKGKFGKTSKSLKSQNIMKPIVGSGGHVDRSASLTAVTEAFTTVNDC